MITSVDRISYWTDSTKWRRLERSGPPKLTRGVADFIPTICQLRNRNSGSGSFSSKCHASPPRRVSTATTLDVNPPYSARNGLVKTLMVCTLSMGMEAPNWPVAGSVAVPELTNKVLRCSALPERLNCPFGKRRIVGANGRASATDAGRSGVFLTSVLSNATGVERLSSSGLSTAPTTVTLSFWMVPAARMASTRCGAPSTKVTSTVSSWKPGAVIPTWYEPGARSVKRMSPAVPVSPSRIENSGERTLTLAPGTGAPCSFRVLTSSATACARFSG